MASSNNSILSILTGVALMATAVAFTPPSSATRQQQHRLTTSSIGALIYYPDDTNSYEDTSMTDDSIFSFRSSSSDSTMPIFSHLASAFSSDPATTLTLAKLASAFSPPGFPIDLANVNDVRCLSVDERHLEIEAVVCDHMECSSLLVPVAFPQECSVDEGLEECILRNVNDLNTRGEHLLQEKENVFADEGEAQRAMEALSSLNSEYFTSTAAAGSLPYWWEAPVSAYDVDECNLLQQLLNSNDFRDMMRGLAEHALLHDSEQDLMGKTIRSVHVKAVGPAGLVMEVQLAFDGGFNNEVLDAPIRFDDMCVNEGAGIREKVLTIVSSVSI